MGKEKEKFAEVLTRRAKMFSYGAARFQNKEYAIRADEILSIADEMGVGAQVKQEAKKVQSIALEQLQEARWKAIEVIGE